MNPLSYNASEPQYPQTADWTCSACSLSWLNRALGIDYATEEFEAADYIGYDHNINSTYGLMDASGQRLVECLREQGAPAFNAWLDYWWSCELAKNMPLLIGGVGWYHWVGVRGYADGVLQLANSAPGWMGVDQTIDEVQWEALGPFAVVAVPLLVHLPPIQTVQ